MVGSGLGIATRISLRRCGVRDDPPTLYVAAEILWRWIVRSRAAKALPGPYSSMRARVDMAVSIWRGLAAAIRVSMFSKSFIFPW